MGRSTQKRNPFGLGAAALIVPTLKACATWPRDTAAFLLWGAWRAYRNRRIKIEQWRKRLGWSRLDSPGPDYHWMRKDG